MKKEKQTPPRGLEERKWSLSPQRRVKAEKYRGEDDWKRRSSGGPRGQRGGRRGSGEGREKVMRQNRGRRRGGAISKHEGKGKNNGESTF